VSWDMANCNQSLESGSVEALVVIGVEPLCVSEAALFGRGMDAHLLGGGGGGAAETGERESSLAAAKGNQHLSSRRSCRVSWAFES
jgi:hypothetical protein